MKAEFCYDKEMNIKYEVKFRLKKIYWFVFRPETTGVKCVLTNSDEILMLKKTFGSTKWVFPGGAVKDGEDKKHACIREIKEDLGVILSDVSYLGCFTQNVHHRKETMHCFSAHVKSKEMSLAQDRVQEAGWFKLSKLPELTPVSASVMKTFSKTK